MLPRNRPEPRLAEIGQALLEGLRYRSTTPEVFCENACRAINLQGTPLPMPSGRAALYFLFRSLPLTRVYVPAYTCWAVLEAARLSGKEVEFLDIDYPGVHVRPDEFERIRGAPGIVVLTHQFGWAEDVRRARNLLGQHGHVLIEDCAGALGTQFRGRVIGNDGDASVFSFEMGKLLGCGGGMLLLHSNDLNAGNLSALTQRQRVPSALTSLWSVALRRIATIPAVYGLALGLILLFRAPTEGFRQPAQLPGSWYRTGMTRAQAALGEALLHRLDTIVAGRRKLLEIYRQGVEGIPDVRNVPMLPGTDASAIRFPFLYKGDKISLHRRLRRKGIDLGFSFSYSLGDADHFPGAARFGREVLNLPLFSEVSPEQASCVLKALKEGVRDNT